MRNIAIADRKDRVSDPTPSARPPRHSMLRDRLATLPILLLAPALIVPMLITSAASPTLRVTPEEPAPGQVVTVKGVGFDRRMDGALLTDDDDEIATFRTDSRGRFTVRFTLPASFDVGDHDITAVDDDGDERAELEIEVVAAPAAPDPTPEPTAAPNAEPTAKPTPTTPPAADPTAAPTPTATATAAPTAAATPTPTATPAPKPTSTPPATPATPPVPVAPGSGILISAAEIARLPTSGAAWTSLKARADASMGVPNISNQDDNTDQQVLAKALVYARTGTASYRASVVSALRSALGTEAGGRTLALGRNLPAYVIAADLISLKTADPTFDNGAFRPWLRALLTKALDGRSLISTHEERPNNWGTHAGAARAAIAAYLGDTTQLARTAQVFRGYLGDRTAYAGFKYGDLAWQCDPFEARGHQPDRVHEERRRDRRCAARGDAARRCLRLAARVHRLRLGGAPGCTAPGRAAPRRRLRRLELVGPRPATGDEVPVRARRAGSPMATTSGSPGSSTAATGRRTAPRHRPGPARTSATPTG